MATTQTLSELIGARLINPDADGSGMDEDARELVANLFAGVANANRIAVLQAIADGRSMAAVAAEDVDISEQAVRSHAERLVDADLVYRTEGGDRLYQVTPFGMFLVQLIEDYQDRVVAAFKAVADAEDDVRDRFEGMNLSEEEMEQQVERLKWDVAADRINEELKMKNQ